MSVWEVRKQKGNELATYATGLLTLCLGCTIFVFEMDPQASPRGIYGRQNGTGPDIQGVTEGKDQTSGECSLGQTIPI